MIESRRPYLLLDRDGTLIREMHYLADPAQVELLPGARELIRAAYDANWGVVILSNQSGVARGYITRENVEAVNRRMLDLIDVSSLTSEHIFMCFHGPDDDCDCRKPKPGLARQAAEAFDIDLSRSVVIGDRLRDLQMGKAVSATTVLVRTGYGAQEEPDAGEETDFIADDLVEVAALNFFGTTSK